MRFLELFAGIGGFRLGLEKAGHTCVWSNEILEKPRRIYARAFGDYPDPRDIRTIEPTDIPDADLLVGGFPCATFSVAGKRTGFGQEDTRGTLFFEVARIARAKRIPYLFLENVKGLLNHDHGRTFGVILATLDELGYDVQWECVNSKHFGVPQNRERVFIVANLRDRPRPQVFPLGICFAENDDESTEEPETGEGISGAYLPCLDAHYYKGGGSRGFIAEDKESDPPHGNTPNESVWVGQWRRSYMREMPNAYTPTLTANMGTGGNNVPFVHVHPVLTPDRVEKRQNGRRIKEHNDPMFTITAQDRHGVLLIPEATTQGYAEATEGDGVDLEYFGSPTRRGRVKKGHAHTLMAGSVHHVVSNARLRKLTPLECERLQSLPENHTKYYDDGSLVPDAQRYERCGRAVTVNVIYEIAKRLPL